MASKDFWFGFLFAIATTAVDQFPQEEARKAGDLIKSAEDLGQWHKIWAVQEYSRKNCRLIGR
jgi:hypothetical protein